MTATVVMTSAAASKKNAGGSRLRKPWEEEEREESLQQGIQSLFWQALAAATADLFGSSMAPGGGTQRDWQPVEGREKDKKKDHFGSESLWIRAADGPDERKKRR